MEDMKRLGKIIILMGLIISLCFGLIYLLKLIGINEGYPTKLVPFISMLSVTVLFLKMTDRKKFSDIGLSNFKSAIGLTCILSLFALMPILIGVISDRGFSLSKPIDTSLPITIGYYFIVGFSEELLYRGYIYNNIEGNILKILISAVAFAGFHLISPEFNLILFIFLFITGILYTYIYKMVKSLWPLIAFHFIWDLGANYTDYYSNALISLLCLAVTAIIVKCIIYLKKKKPLYLPAR